MKYILTFLLLIGVVYGQTYTEITESKDTIVYSYKPGTPAIFTPGTIPIFTRTVKPYKGTIPPVDPPPTIPPPSGNYGTLVFERAYNNSNDINSNQLGEGSFSTKDGGAFKSLVTGGQSSSGSYRSEQQFDGSLYNPTEFVLEYDAFYENWKNFGNNSGHVVQWHPHATGGSATISIYGYQGQFEVVRNLGGSNYRDNAYTSGKKSITPSVWIKHRWEIKWGNPGYVKLYLDDVLYFNYTGQTRSESQNPYFKLGQNRWVVGGGSSTIYYRNLKIWKR